MKKPKSEDDEQIPSSKKDIRRSKKQSEIQNSEFLVPKEEPQETPQFTEKHRRDHKSDEGGRRYEQEKSREYRGMNREKKSFCMLLFFNQFLLFF